MNIFLINFQIKNHNEGVALVAAPTVNTATQVLQTQGRYHDMGYRIKDVSLLKNTMAPCDCGSEILKEVVVENGCCEEHHHHHHSVNHCNPDPCIHPTTSHGCCHNQKTHTCKCNSSCGGEAFIKHRWEGTTLVITTQAGTSAMDLIGPQGEQGEPGTIDFEQLTAEQLELLRGPKGEDGNTPIKGEDYFTQEEINNIIEAVKQAIINTGLGSGYDDTELRNLINNKLDKTNDVTNQMLEDSDKVITSGGVYEVVGDIQTLLTKI